MSPFFRICIAMVLLGSALPAAAQNALRPVEVCVNSEGAYAGRARFETTGTPGAAPGWTALAVGQRHCKRFTEGQNVTLTAEYWLRMVWHPICTQAVTARRGTSVTLRGSIFSQSCTVG